jgi:hypothetical protein
MYGEGRALGQETAAVEPHTVADDLHGQPTALLRVGGGFMRRGCYIQRKPGSGDVHGTRRGRCYALRSPRHLSDRSTRVVLP